jgi:4a-hydroxytetrahydrobiopterin dehydratase
MEVKLPGLASHNCIPCRGREQALSEDEAVSLLVEVPAWEKFELEGISRLKRTFKVRDFKQAIAFTNLVAELAESQDHHPLIVIEWGRITVQWWTHVIEGLHKNDFIMAAKTDELFNTTALD